MSKSKVVAYYGHHKCASSWISDIIAETCTGAGWRSEVVHSAEKFDADPEQYIAAQQIDFLNFTNADKSTVEHLRNVDRAFHVIRDPRDIVVSAYFSHLYSHPLTEEWPELADFRDKLEKVPLSEGLLMEIEFRKKEFTEMAEWSYAQENVLELKMEDLISDPFRQFIEAFEFLGVLDTDKLTSLRQLQISMLQLYNKATQRYSPTFSLRQKMPKIPVNFLLSAIYGNRFEAKSKGRVKGQENRDSHYRRGQPGEWVEYFAPEHKALFKEAHEDLLVMLGYESHNDW